MGFELNFTLISALVLSLVICLLIDKITSPRHDKTEPPLTPSKVPILGHLMGVVRSGQFYYTKVNAKCSLPIFILNILNKRTYVVNDLDLVGAVNRNSKEITFLPMAIDLSTRISGASKVAGDILRYEPPSSDTDLGCVPAVFKEMRKTLNPGPELNEMNRAMIKSLGTILDSFRTKGGREIDLLDWSTDTITMATLAQMLSTGLVIRSAYRSRENLVFALTEYFNSENLEEGSGLIKAQFSGFASYGIQTSDAARFDTINLVGVLVNTAPSTFWMIARIVSTPGLLVDLREELDSVTTTQTKDDNPITRIIDVTSVKIRCPLLISVSQEVLRIHSGSATNRVIIQDTVLANKDSTYYLKKGAILQMPTTAIHFNTEIYGPTARIFKPRRFLNSKDKPQAAAVRTFGGGAWMCPGRHFVTTEILAITAMLVVRYDIRSIGGNGEWVLPTTNKTGSLAAIIPPDYDVKVSVATRKGFEGDQWEFMLSNSKGAKEQALPW